MTDNKSIPDFLSTDEAALLKRTLLKDFTEDEQETFVRICHRTRLDPFTKQIYATRRYQKITGSSGETRKVPVLVPVTGIVGLTAVADRTGQYDGCEIFWCGPDAQWKNEWVSGEFPAAAKCIVYHKQRTKPEVAIAVWASYAGQTYNYQIKQWEVSDFWAKMPAWMIAKCSKAAALRGAFPDPLSNVYIREELDSDVTDAETEAIPSDEAKIAANQRREAEILENVPPRITVVETHGVRPTPATALEPAFPEDREPVPPAPARTQAAPGPDAAQVSPKPAAQPVATPTHTEEKQQPDDLDMTPVPPPPEPIATPWKDHVIKGVKSDRYKDRKIGELNELELKVIATQWLPKVRAQWNDATEDQKADAAMFEAAIAYYDVARPW